MTYGNKDESNGHVTVVTHVALSLCLPQKIISSNVMLFLKCWIFYFLKEWCIFMKYVKLRTVYWSQDLYLYTKPGISLPKNVGKMLFGDISLIRNLALLTCFWQLGGIKMYEAGHLGVEQTVLLRPPCVCNASLLHSHGPTANLCMQFYWCVDLLLHLI